MILKRQILRVLLTGGALLVFSNEASATEKYVGHCDVVFEVDSTLHGFTGNITNVPVVVLCDTNSAGEAILNTRIEIRPKQLTTHHEKRDAHMYEMFKTDRFPKLTVVVTNASLAIANFKPMETSGAVGSLPVQLTFCGITKEAQAKTSNVKPHTDGWEFDLATDVSLKAFKLEPPTMMFGAISVSDTVKIKAYVKVKKEIANP